MKQIFLWVFIFSILNPSNLLKKPYYIFNNHFKETSSKEINTREGSNYTETYAGLNIEMVFIQGSTFLMGCTPENDSSCFDYEKPRHKVTLVDFYMGQTEVTVAQFGVFINETSYITDAERNKQSYVIDKHGNWKDATGINWRYDAKGQIRKKSEYNHPVIHVSWNDAKAYCDWLTQKTEKKYQLPSESQWEYTCRSRGKDHKYAWGNSTPSKSNGGNIADESIKKKFRDWTVWNAYNDGYVYTAPVNSYGTNDAGIADMSGNVTEMCNDWYRRDFYKISDTNNPENLTEGSCRVIRGGSWSDEPKNLRCSYRSCTPPNYCDGNIGFRICKVN